MMYADFEENFGLTSYAMDVYDRATRDIREDTIEVWNLYIAKATQYFGIVRTRQVYEKAIKLLKGKELILLGLRFAKLERKLNDVERARAVYSHLSQFCSPSVYQSAFWDVWE
jgi:pre-mRNA-splicing factor SYF1